MSEGGPFRIGAAGVDEADVGKRCLRANAERRSRGAIEPGEPERIAALEPRVLADLGPEGGRIVEALRLMQRAAAVDEPRPIASHRPFLGPFLVALKRVVRRLLRFETAEPWVRQAEFNRAAAAFARAVLGELARREAAGGAGQGGEAEPRRTP